MAHWITDGSSGFTINGSTVTFVSTDVGSVQFNCMWQDDDDGVSSGKHYWKIHLETLGGDAGVGLTSQKYFKRGWGLRALTYGGNLSDGGGLLVREFGPSLSFGDTVGILASFEGDRLKVYFEINGKSLGLAFDVSTLRSVFPVISFNKFGSATCRKETVIPDLTSRFRTAFTGIEGYWKLAKIENGTSATLFEGNDDAPTTKLIKTGEGTYTWEIETPGLYGTIFGARLSFENQIWKISDYQAISFRGGDAILDDIDDLIKMVKVVQVEPNGNLSVKSEKISSNWIRYDAAPGPYVSNTFP